MHRLRNRLMLVFAGFTLGVVALFALYAAVFVYAAWRLNPLCFMLSPVALAIVFWYSLAKRFTTWTQLFLGLAMAVAPVGGWLAVGGRGGWEPWLLGLAICAWVGGFDVFYALQDEEFDRRQGLKSAIVALGRTRAILATKWAHGLTIALLVLFGAGAGLGAAYYLGIAVAAGLLVWEHRLVKPDDLSRLDAAFFTMNGVMSIVVFAGALVDRVL